MNESVGFAEPDPTRNSLILIGLTFRTFSTAASECVLPVAAFVQLACATRSPLKGVWPEVILNVALTLAPGAMGPAIDSTALELAFTTEVHSRGTLTLSFRSFAGAPVVLVNRTVVSCDDSGVNV